MASVLRRLLVPLALVAALAAACTGGGVGPTPPPDSPPNLGTSPDATNATTTPLLPTDRFELPRFTPDEFQQLLTQLKGTPVVVNFWASWCGPCVEEAPGLRDVSQEFGDKVQFLGVDLKDRKEAAQISIRDFAYPYPSVADPEGEIQRSFGFFAQPVTVFFDRNGDRVDVTDNLGNVVPQYSGAIPEDVLRAEVGKLAGD
jgi:thiol-disulfide isomerase/thioredoxin